MEGLIDTVTNRDNMIAALAAVATMAAVITVISPFLQRDPMKDRIKNVSQYKENLRQQHRESLKQRGGDAKLRNASAKGMAREIVQQFKLLELFDSESAAKKLSMAGYRGERPVYTFMFFRLATPIMAGIAAFIYIYVMEAVEWDSLMKLLGNIGAVVAGFYLPNIYLENTIANRQQKMQLAFPDALDLLLICVESGMSIEHALQKVSEEIGGNCPPLAEELGLTTAELSYLSERKQAYINLGERTGLEGVKAVTTALIQSEQYGTPLGTSLRVMANENREIRMQNAEKKAAALPPKLTVPMILFFLPVLFVVILGPAGLRVLGFAD
jgi:tight adherence protein C